MNNNSSVKLRIELSCTRITNVAEWANSPKGIYLQFTAISSETNGGVAKPQAVSILYSPFSTQHSSFSFIPHPSSLILPIPAGLIVLAD